MAQSQHLLHLNIELMDITPVVWRMVVVPDSVTLVQLHHVIQSAMGWMDVHLHEFEIDGRRYGQPAENFGMQPEMLNERGKRLLKLLGDHKALSYVYDFGDYWRHAITVTSVVPMTQPARSALCIGGENACPPEDVGGPPGYDDFVKIVRDPAHEEYEAMTQWCGGAFDPTAFDIHHANMLLKYVKV